MQAPLTATSDGSSAGEGVPRAHARVPVVALQAYLLGLSGVAASVGTRRQAVPQGPPLRPVLTPAALVLPDFYRLSDGAAREPWWRAATAHAAAHLLFSVAGQPAGALKPLALTVAAVLEDARVEALLGRRCPGLPGLWRGLHTVTPAAGLDCPVLLARLSRALADPNYRDDNFWVDKGRRLFDAQRHRLEQAEVFRAIATLLANDLGQMRVQFDVRAYAAAPAYRDDHSYLWDYSGAPSEAAAIELAVVLQPGGNAPGRDAAIGSAQVPAHAGAGAVAGDPSPPAMQGEGNHARQPAQAATPGELRNSGGTWNVHRRVPYPEWDDRIETFRAGWCTLLEHSAREENDAAGARESARTAAPRRSAARILERGLRLRRQAQGERFDLDALIDALASRRQGGYLDERVYERAGLRAPGSALLLLLDASASTAQPLREGAATVLATEKALAVQAIEAILPGGAHRIAVHGFASNTRKQVHYERYLDFGMRWGNAPRTRLLAAPSAGSTRFGAALRHATAVLATQPGAARVIVMITDGAPADIDVTRAAYLVEDARLAVLQARRAGVRCYCIALDAQADLYVRRIFGVRNYLIAADPGFVRKRFGPLLDSLLQG